MQAVLFDMDGTLVDSEPFYYARKLRFLAAKNIVVQEAIMQKFIGRNMRDFFHELFEDAQAIKYYHEYRDFIQAYPVNYQDILFPETKEVLQACKTKGYQIALVSSSPWENIQAMLTQCGFQTLFDVVVSGDDHPYAKPDPAVYLEAMKQLSLTPEQCMVVEDSISGIQAGKAAGCFVAAKTSSITTMVQNDADVTITSLFDLLDILENRKCQ